MRAALIALAAGLALGAGGAWWAQGQRYSLQLEELKHATTSKELAGTRQAVTGMVSFQKGFNDALQQFQSIQQGNAQAQQDLGRVLLDLRGITVGLQGCGATLPVYPRALLQLPAPPSASTPHLHSRIRSNGSRRRKTGRSWCKARSTS